MRTIGFVFTMGLHEAPFMREPVGERVLSVRAPNSNSVLLHQLVYTCSKSCAQQLNPTYSGLL